MKRSIAFSVLVAALLLLTACSPKLPEKTETLPVPAVSEEPAVEVEPVEPESEPEPEPQANIPTPSPTPTPKAAPTPPAPVAPPPATTPAPASSAPVAAPSVRTVTLSAQRFEFGPASIRMKANEKLIVKINNIDFTHGVTIPALGIYETDEIILDKIAPGTYEFRCANYCGEGHSNMKGTLIVE